MTRDEYAELLLHLSARIVGAVHDEGPDAISKAIDRALIVEAPPEVDPVQALITVLAAQVDEDRRHTESLRWLWERQVVDDTLRLARKHARAA